MSSVEKVEMVSKVMSQVLEQRGNETIELELSDEEADQVVAGLTLYRQELEEQT